MISVGTGLIPFLEHNDANRALMGSNMQRQAVGIENPEAPRLQTGIENEIGRLSNSTLESNKDGKIILRTIKQIITKSKTQKVEKARTNSLKKKKQTKEKNYFKPTKNDYIIYKLKSTRKSNQNTFLKQVININTNEYIKKGQIIADSNNTKYGKIALGKTLLVGYMSWEGYNFEDAIVINKRLVDEEIFTSYHIKKYKTFLINSETEEVRIQINLTKN
jgi:DNA-directed RNA polymerase subunit beta